MKHVLAISIDYVPAAKNDNYAQRSMLSIVTYSKQVLQLEIGFKC